MRPVIALLSDFGSRDHYAGTMKGVMIGICPDVTFVDITHDITPHDVVEGALQLVASYRFFPAGTIFLAIVDPGVGSLRRGIAAEAGDYRFVAPDNGVLTAVFRELPPKRIVELTERRYARPTVSRTFEGRDRFAPAAAWLGKGIQLSALGRTVTGYQQLE
ncbi:MAG TPA: SAM-dependent chlorinase/fluorinase, partial [Gemmatimonadaceae bacterium]|nr:SAM-dependent chlorinase/fluorinase [Gemmatimonadaceae bacterium]